MRQPRYSRARAVLCVVISLVAILVLSHGLSAGEIFLDVDFMNEPPPNQDDRWTRIKARRQAADHWLSISRLENLAIVDAEFRSLDSNDIRSRFGKGLTFWDASRYVRPLGAPESIYLGKASAVKSITVKLYPLKGVGGLLVFFAKRKALPRTAVLLEVSRGYSPLKEVGQIEDRIRWEAKKIELLKRWVAIRDGREMDQRAISWTREQIAWGDAMRTPKQVAGSWEVVSETIMGVEMQPKRQTTYDFVDDKLKVSPIETNIGGPVKFDAAGSIMAVRIVRRRDGDFEMTEHFQRGASLAAIRFDRRFGSLMQFEKDKRNTTITSEVIRVRGEDMTIFYGLTKGMKPEDAKSTRGNGVEIVKLKRVKGN